MHIDDAATKPDNEKTIPIPLSLDDYLGGIFDLSGELMRHAVTGMARGAVPAGPDGRSELVDLQGLRFLLEGLDALAGSPYAWRGKMEVLGQSVAKVERGVYAAVVRGRERPVGWVGGMEEARVEG